MNEHVRSIVDTMPTRMQVIVGMIAGLSPIRYADIASSLVVSDATIRNDVRSANAVLAGHAQIVNTRGVLTFVEEQPEPEPQPAEPVEPEAPEVSEPAPAEKPVSTRATTPKRGLHVFVLPWGGCVDLHDVIGVQAEVDNAGRVRVMLQLHAGGYLRSPHQPNAADIVAAIVKAKTSVPGTQVYSMEPAHAEGDR